MALRTKKNLSHQLSFPGGDINDFLNKMASPLDDDYVPNFANHSHKSSPRTSVADARTSVDSKGAPGSGFGRSTPRDSFISPRGSFALPVKPALGRSATAITNLTSISSRRSSVSIQKPEYHVMRTSNTTTASNRNSRTGTFSLSARASISGISSRLSSSANFAMQSPRAINICESNGTIDYDTWNDSFVISVTEGKGMSVGGDEMESSTDDRKSCELTPMGRKASIVPMIAEVSLREVQTFANAKGKIFE